MKKLTPIFSTPYPVYDARELKKAYQSGHEQAALTAVHEMMSHYIYFEMNKRFHEYMASLKEDMYSNAITQVFDDFINNYEPEKGKLTTYLKYSILKACTELIDAETHHTTSYHSKKIRLVRKACQEWEETHHGGFCPPEFIAQKTGLSLNVVMETLARIELEDHKISLDKENEEGDTMANAIPSMETSPETKYLEKIEREALKEALATLDDDELLLIEVRYFKGNKTTSIADVAAELNMAEAKVKNKLDKILKKLRHRTPLYNTLTSNSSLYDKADYKF